jgi:hypothetical protein
LEIVEIIFKKNIPDYQSDNKMKHKEVKEGRARKGHNVMMSQVI